MTDSRLDHALDYRFLIMPFRVDYLDLRGLERPKTKIMMNLGNPDEAFALSFIPNDGVGLARQEFNRPTRNLVPVQWTSTCPSAMDTSVKTTGSGAPCRQGLRFLRPLDIETVLASVRKTHRAVVIDEAWRTGSFAAEVSAQITEGAFYDLGAPVMRVCSAEVPIPYAKHLEDAALPQLGAIVRTVHLMLRVSS
jgi:transketolase-like protein